MTESKADGAERWGAAMARARRLALRGRGRVAPNPLVGCVVVSEDGVVVGEGYHRALGDSHAEVVALEAAGKRARGATAVVTLEPCNHHGRTPPCTEALIEAGVARVVVAHRDPNPQVAGQGFERLRRAGVEVIEGVGAEEAALLNLGYLVAHTRERVGVTVKWAMSLDGRIATATGESQWISSDAGRRWALELREWHDAILVGSGTVLGDDPRLTRRLGRARGPITRVVLDRRLRVPPEARLFSEPGPVLVYTEEADTLRRTALEARGATVVVLPEVGPRTVGRDLHRRGLHSCLVEGGSEVLAAFVAAGVYDRVAVCCAPRLLGGRDAPGPLGGTGLGSLAECPVLEGVRVGRRGPDTIITGLRQGCLQDLLSSVDD